MTTWEVKKKTSKSEPVDYQTEYLFCIGEVGLSKDEYFLLTPAETAAKVKGYITKRDTMSANFRALYYLMFNQWAKTPKSPHELWPLSIDKEEDEEPIEQTYERNRQLIEQLTKI